MIKFPTNQGDVMMETSKEALRECKHLERVQGSWKETQWRQREQQMSRIREQASLRSKVNSGRGALVRGGVVRCQLKKTRCKRNAEEYSPPAMNITGRYVTMGSYVDKQLAGRYWQTFYGRNMEVFHGLLIQKSTLFCDSSWSSIKNVDYSSLNKACAKDMYPFPKEEEELASSMGYPYKYFLRLLKEYIQIRMAEDDDEKAWFHMEEGIYCFTHMPKELKNSAATL
ncbi:hypothetical protein Tco_0769380 [Tanacetum coccineum]|uniref:Uncharacterized protein n=1 Tax=Tanacetum coccineum TaxID=301880 RepID=A0ABQ4Z984_9ASTR